MIDLIGDYGQNVDEKEYEKLENQLTPAGVNMDRLNSYQKSYEQAMQQQIEAQQAAAAQQQNDGEGADELNAVLGN